MGNFNKKFNARNPLKATANIGNGTTYSSAIRSPLGYSPFKQVEGETNTNVGLLSSEDPDTYVYDGTDLHERIIDLEERISFIQEDIWNVQEGPADAPTDESQGTDQQKQDLATLRAELAKLRGE